MSPTVKLAEYLFTRLRQLGVQSIHGVPGDYNLELLDYLEPSKLQWVGNCNELNAGYAADAYARMKGLGALITTFGVGELSAINALAGAYAELAPVVHIVGTPARWQQENRALIHHTLNDGEYGHFARMYSNVTVAQANLLDPRTSTHFIDSTLQQCLMHSRPVYIQVPTDMVAVEVPADRLRKQVTIPQSLHSPALDSALELVLQRMYSSERPLILFDGESQAYGIVALLEELIQKTEWPTWTTVFGKGLINETLPNFRGIWKGSWADAEDAKYVASADLILCLGPHFSDTNTYAYSSIPNASATTFFSRNTIRTQNETFRDVPTRDFLTRLLRELDVSKIHRPDDSRLSASKTPLMPDLVAKDNICQQHFYKFIATFVRSGDIVLAETGTAGHGCRDMPLPPHTRLFKPTTWLSIGYMLPAAQGAALAQEELHATGNLRREKNTGMPRTILLTGDGSFQMTAQELSTIIRHQLNVVIFLINNDGYTIERCIHGYQQHYNDVASWRYLQAPSFFGAREEHEVDEHSYYAKTTLAKTWADLALALKDDASTGSRLHMIEVVMDREDAPVTLLKGLQEQKSRGLTTARGLHKVVLDGFELLGTGAMTDRVVRNESWMKPISAEKLVYLVGED